VVVKRHDRYQFEVKLNFDFSGGRYKDRYQVESYFFIPNNLDINEQTYSREVFYRDLLVYIRFRTPPFTLRALAERENPRNPLNAFTQKPGERLDGETASRLVYELKLFGCIVKSALRDHLSVGNRLLSRWVPNAETGTDNERWRRHVNDYASNLERILERFRALEPWFSTEAVPASLQSAFAYTDEYISLLVEWRTLQLLRQIEKEPHGSTPYETRARLRNLIQREVARRKEKGYPTILSADEDNELFVFRFGVLKKFVSSVLHLNMRTVAEGRGLQQLAFGLAAGGAMVFATAVAFYYQRLYGTLSLGFFAALVISYMLKDRIKALLQETLHRLLSRTLFDQSTRISSTPGGRTIGKCSESFQFVNEGSVDPEVRRLRDRDHLTEIENDFRSEKIIYYLKEVFLFSGRFLKRGSRKNGLTDIVRFNVQNFLRKMDEPRTRLMVLQGDHSGEIEASRVYHVNLVIKLLSRRNTRYERIRLVLDQNGIKRIETVTSSSFPAAH